MTNYPEADILATPYLNGRGEALFFAFEWNGDPNGRIRVSRELADEAQFPTTLGSRFQIGQFHLRIVQTYLNGDFDVMQELY